MADAKIEKLRELAEQNPNDELAHFSLGSALLEAGDAAGAAQCIQRVLAVNPQNSKAYQILATAQKQTGHTEYAIETARTGHRIAHKRGDLMPMNALADLLRELGQEVPDLSEQKKVSAGGASGGGFACTRCGSPGPRLERQPFKGELGAKVLERICNNCWQEWIRMGTKVINELRLPLHDPKAQEMYDQHMQEFLGFSE